MKHVAETERLIIREQTEADAPFIYKLMNSEGWLKNIGDRNIKTTEDAAAYIRNGAMKSYAEHGFGFFLVTLKDGTPVGLSGLARRDTLEHVDIGFAFMPEHEGKGYGYESASAVMELARGAHQLPAVAAITVKENTPSIKLIEKLGLTFSRMIDFPGDDEQIMLFERRF